MSVMSEMHIDLVTIHAILLGQRKVAQDSLNDLVYSESPGSCLALEQRVDCINDLLLEFEAAGVVWPDNVVELSVQQAWDKGLPVLSLCNCKGALHPEHGPNC